MRLTYIFCLFLHLLWVKYQSGTRNYHYDGSNDKCEDGPHDVAAGSDEELQLPRVWILWRIRDHVQLRVGDEDLRTTNLNCKFLK